jgi:hypothetical protein
MNSTAPQTVPDGTTTTGIEAMVCADIARRQAMGWTKYGTTVAGNPAHAWSWAKHAYEEALDMAIYLRRLMTELSPAQRPASLQASTRQQTIAFHTATPACLPDAELNVLLLLRSGDSTEGFLDGQHDDGSPLWRDVTAMPLDRAAVLEWAYMPTRDAAAAPGLQPAPAAQAAQG